MGSFIDLNTDGLKGIEDINEQYEKWTEILDRKATNVFIPSCNTSNNFKTSKTNPKWFNPSLKKLTKKKYQLYMKMRTRSSREALKEEYKSTCKKF